MIGNDRVCGICSTEVAYISCICNRDVKLLCKSCIADHLADYFQVHELISLELGFKLQYNPSGMEEYYLETKQVDSIVHSLNTHLTSTKRVLNKVTESRGLLKNEIDYIIDSILSRLQEAIHEDQRKLKLASDFKRTLCEEGRSLVKSYEIGGEDELVGMKFDKVEIPIEEIASYLREMINIDNLTCGQVTNKRPRIEEESKFKLNEQEEADYTYKIRDLEDKLSQSRSEASHYASKVTDLENKLSQSKHQTADYILKIKNSEGLLSQKNIEVSDFNTKVGALEEILIKKSAEIEDYILKIKNSEGLLSQKNAEVINRDNNIRNLEEMLTKKSSEVEDNILKIRSLEEILSRKNIEVADSGNKIRDLEEILNKRSDEIAGYILKIKSLEEILSNSRNEASYLNIKLKELEDLLCQKNTEVESNILKIRSLEEIIANQSAEIADNLLKMRNLEEKLYNSISETTDLTIKIRDLEEILSRKSAEVADSLLNIRNLEEKLCQKSTEVDHKFLKIRELEEKLSQKVAEVAGNLLNIRNLEERESQSRYEVEGYINKVRELDQMLSKRTAELAENNPKINPLDENLYHRRQESIVYNSNSIENQAEMRSTSHQLKLNQSIDILTKSTNMEILDEERQDHIILLTQQLDEITNSYMDIDKEVMIEDINNLSTPQQRRLHFEKYAGTRYLYNAKCGTNSLHMYDILTKKARIIEICGMNRKFYNISTCELPNGDVFITGFNNPVSKDTYIYQQDTQRCKQLPGMPTARYGLGLYFYRGYVYAFGGKDSSGNSIKEAERFDIGGNIWERLEPMRYAADYLTCLGIGDKIFLFSSENYINTFNTKQCEFEGFGFEYLNCDRHETRLAVTIGEKVCLIDSYGISIFTTDMRPLNYLPNHIRNTIASSNSAILYQNNLYFYNIPTSLIQKVNLSFANKGKREIPNHFKPAYNTRYLYKAISGSKELLRLEVKYKTTESISTSAFLGRDFSDTTAYKLPSGEVFIVGFSNPLSGDCYIYNPEQNSITNLPKLIVPRYLLSLIYHSHSLYAFGGYLDQDMPTKSSERFDLIRKQWSKLSDMNQARAKASCIGIENLIYIFGGGVDYIEIFDIATNSFNSCHMMIKSLQVVSFLKDDSIYLIDTSGVKIFDKELKNIKECRAGWESHYPTFTSENVILYKDTVYFFNYSMGMPEKIKIPSFKRGILVTNDN
jgi:hypothetical protein